MVEMSEVVATAVAAAMVLVIRVMAQTSGRGWAAMVAVMRRSIRRAYDQATSVAMSRHAGRGRLLPPMSAGK